MSSPWTSPAPALHTSAAVRRGEFCHFAKGKVVATLQLRGRKEGPIGAARTAQARTAAGVKDSERCIAADAGKGLDSRSDVRSGEFRAGADDRSKVSSRTQS